MPTRRKFLTQAALGTTATFIGIGCESAESQNQELAIYATPVRPIVISTWDFGKKANEAAMKILGDGGSALDAVEQGVRVIEADETNQSVGIGGRPDREGAVTLDACIMGPDGMCGSVCALEDILHPVTVARMVMERTPHVILVGQGAQDFAVSQGMEKVNLLTEKSKRDWEAWRVEAKYEPKVNSEKHDTIGMLAIDSNGNISGACTTSGMAYKMRGRVGDSPIIGAGLFVDNEVGAATATGNGEAMLRTLSSFLVVEMMRQGKSPEEACRLAIERILKTHSDTKNLQVGLIAVNKKGQSGGYCIHPGFEYAQFADEKNIIVKPKSIL